MPQTNTQQNKDNILFPSTAGTGIGYNPFGQQNQSSNIFGPSNAIGQRPADPAPASNIFGNQPTHSTSNNTNAANNFTITNEHTKPFMLYFMPIGNDLQAVPKELKDFTSLPSFQSQISDQLQNIKIQPQVTQLEAFQQKLESSFLDNASVSQHVPTFNRAAYHEAKRNALTKLTTIGRPTASNSSFVRTKQREEQASFRQPDRTDAQADSSEKDKLTISLFYKGGFPITIRESFAPNVALAAVLDFLCSDRKLLSRTDLKHAKLSAGLKKLELFDHVRDIDLTREVLKVVVPASTEARQSTQEDQAKPLLSPNSELQTQPTASELQQMSQQELSAVENFCVWNKFVRIEFQKPVDLRNVNLDETVKLEYKSAQVYGEDKNKQEVGKGLNQPAHITYFGFKVPKDADDLERFEEKMTDLAAKRKAKLIGINTEDNSITIGVKNF